MKSVLFVLIAAVCSASACVVGNSAKDKTSTETAAASRRTDNVSDRKEVAAKNSATKDAKISETKSERANESAQAANAVCPDPAQPCHHRRRKFEAWELPFRLPARIVANKTYSSAPFYAVILKKYENACDEGLDYDSKIEAERIALQKKFPKKVFAEYSCPNLDAVGYSFEGKMDAEGEYVLYMNYVAVYAGATEAEARAVFEKVRADYPQAELKRMTATYERLEM